MQELSTMVELTGPELDAVAAGQATAVGGAIQGGLVDVNVSGIAANRVVSVDRNNVEVIKNAIVVVDVL
jgi:hypothetical protein